MRNCDSQVQTVDRMTKGATVVEAVKLAKEMEPESVAVGVIATNNVTVCRTAST